MKRKIIYISIFIILIALGVIFYLSKRGTLDAHQKCPDEYANTEVGTIEYKTDIDKWTNSFYDSHPGSTLSDWSKARYQFWVANGCVAALRRYEEGLNGKDPDKIKLINDTIKETVIYEQ